MIFCHVKLCQECLSVLTVHFKREGRLTGTGAPSGCKVPRAPELSFSTRSRLASAAVGAKPLPDDADLVGLKRIAAHRYQLRSCSRTPWYSNPLLGAWAFPDWAFLRHGPPA